jgi:hypothetical protein
MCDALCARVTLRPEISNATTGRSPQGSSVESDDAWRCAVIRAATSAATRDAHHADSGSAARPIRMPTASGSPPARDSTRAMNAVTA